MHAGTVEASTSLAATLLWMTVAVPVVSSIDDGVLTERSTAVVWLPEALYVRESDFFARLALSRGLIAGSMSSPIGRGSSGELLPGREDGASCPVSTGDNANTAGSRSLSTRVAASTGGLLDTTGSSLTTAGGSPGAVCSRWLPGRGVRSASELDRRCRYVGSTLLVNRRFVSGCEGT